MDDDLIVTICLAVLFGVGCIAAGMLLAHYMIWGF